LADGAFGASVAFLADALSSETANGAQRGEASCLNDGSAPTPESRSVFRNFNERGRAERRSAASTD
jgi:hypothetical protein